MLAQLRMALLARAVVAVQAGLRNVVRGEVFHRDDGAVGPACLDMLRRIAMTLLARKVCFPRMRVRGILIGGNFVFMALDAGLRIGCLCVRDSRRVRLSFRFGGCHWDGCVCPSSYRRGTGDQYSSG